MGADVVKEFIEAIKEPPQDNTRAYSAIVSRIDDEGTVWVHLAGSEKETPTALVASEVERGDVVNVEWRNNRLYVANNVSNPAAGYFTTQGAVDFVAALEGQDVSVNSITAATGYIDDLYSKNITTENIKATNGYIQHLVAEHITAEDISASSGYIKDLTSENITAQNIIADHETVGTLDATYATIANLNAANGRINNLEANEAVINDTLKATNAEVEYLSSDWISTDRLVLTGNNKNNYPPVQITETEFNANKTAYWTKDGDNYTQCTTSSVYDPDKQYYARQTVQSIIEAINTANNTDPQVIVSNDKLIAASMDVAELSAITADMGTLTAGKIQKGNNFINLNTVPATMEFKNAETWAAATNGIQWDALGNLNIKGSIEVTGGNVYSKEEIDESLGYVPMLEISRAWEGDNVTLSARVFVNGEDKTDDYTADQFSWYRKSESDIGAFIGTGKSKTITLGAMRYGGAVTCELWIPQEINITDSSGNIMTGSDGALIALV